MPDPKPAAAYLLAVGTHLDECETDIATLREILAERPWSRLERHAAERTLQILIEGCIGLAKHWAKRELGRPVSEPSTAFERLIDRGCIGHEVPWRKVIGLRNALVHDYLDVDPEIVRDVIEQAHHRALLAFGRQAIEALATGEESP
ncbi:DUF86 domain-containing protein [Halomonas sp. BM-2019]|uniref:type VII toxin-antitoxin system HepT family RNase toxin n=1 Tax=Halomonas sp. BM-2019 TaxID=2811227 RepID=UPI001B3C482D|nr:MAG: DUF86 domain-containing protein [Halomonas sp. BM-2019]